MRSFKTLHSAILTVLLTLSLCACSAQNSASKAEEAQAVSTQTKEAQTAGLPQDGTYEPASFTAEGGTGKVQITCPEITIENGAAQALIEFSSPHYDWVKVDGAQYDPENADKEDRENSVFRIPVRLDEKTFRRFARFDMLRLRKRWVKAFCASGRGNAFKEFAIKRNICAFGEVRTLMRCLTTEQCRL